jgi:hypothetical protein
MKPRGRSIGKPLALAVGLLLAMGLVVASIAMADINCPTGANGLCEGGSGNNNFIGTNNHDHILGYGGDDEWNAMDDADNIEGGAGTDTGGAGHGADTIDGGDGDDQYGNTQLYLDGGQGPDDIYGGDGMDSLDGDEDGDTMHGNNGTDIVYGAFGGPKGADHLYCGDPGNDHYSADSSDTVDSDCEIPLD